MRKRAIDAARAVAVFTEGWPLLAPTYAAIYRATVQRLRWSMRDVVGVESVLLRGSAGRRVTPGLSDIDAVVVLRSRSSARDEIRAVARIDRRLRRTNVPFPLVRDVHIVTPEELAAWGELCVYLLGALHVDSAPLVGRTALPSCARGATRVGESLLRGVAWWTDRGLRQLLLEPGAVGRRLAARSFEKARRFAAAAASSPDDILPTMRTYNAPSNTTPAGFGDALRALRTLDDALPTGRALEESTRTEHPTVERAVERLRSWVEPLRRQGVFRGAVLSTEGASRADLRLFLVLDPTDDRSADALRSLARRLRDEPMPHRALFSRCPFPIVVTRRQLARSVFLRWTALEPVARSRHGRVLFGDCPAPEATPDEIVSSLAYEAAHILGSARELLRHRRAPSVSDRMCDLADNVAESYRSALAGEWVTSPTSLEGARRRGAEAAYEDLHAAVTRTRDPMVTLATRRSRGDTP